MRRLVVLLLLFSSLAPSAAEAANEAARGVQRPGDTPRERRIALVIGNGAYKVGPLRNAVNDASDVAAALREMRFEVDLLRDVSKRQIDAAINRMASTLGGSDVGLFYFAGHGVQDADGQNYLVPVDAVLDLPVDIQDRAVPVRRILGAMEEARNATNIIILDACRDNPFPRPSRSAQRGLAAVQAINGSLIAYATAPGSVAADGPRRNGVYTEQLLRAMRLPGLPLEQVFKQVRIGVRNETKERQIPWETSSLTEDFFFLSPADGTSVRPVVITPTPRQSAPAPSVEDQVASLPPQRHVERRVYVEPDGPSRYVAEHLQRQLVEQHATIVTRAEARTARRIVVRSTIANDSAYETKLTRLRVTVSVRDATGRELLSESLDATGSSPTDYDAALKDASQIWAAAAHRQGLAEKILLAEER